MNPLISMGFNPPNPVAAYTGGVEAKGIVDDRQNQNALRGYIQQNGAGIMSGDQNALAGLGGMGPQGLEMAMGVQNQQLNQDATRQGMENDKARLGLAFQQAERQGRQWAQQMSAQEAQQSAAEMRQLLEGALFAGQQGDAELQAYLAPHAPALSEMGIDVAEINTQNLPQYAVGVGGVASGLIADIQGGGKDTVGAQEILEDGTVIQSTGAGVRVMSPTGEQLTGQAAQDAIRAAREFEVENQRNIYGARREGTLATDIEMGGTAESAKRGGQIAADLGKEAYDAYSVTAKSLGTINEAIAAIDAGAKSGIVAKYAPNITLASASLENAMNRMGLDVIGAVTFGALSVAEMNLAMEVAVPRNLQPTQLREWLSRKAEAQEKAGQALLAAGRYLSTPGNTLSGWMEQQQANKSSGDLPPTPKGAAGMPSVQSIEEAMALPAGTRFVDPNGVVRTR